MASSASHADPFSRPPGRILSNSSSGSSSWSDHRHWASHPDDMVQPFTADMRDRQARGKDPYVPEDDSNGADFARRAGRAAPPMGIHAMGGGSVRLGGGAPSRQLKEPFQKTERRDWAETVLDSPELLMLYAHSTGETLPVARMRFKKIMCGLDDYEEDDTSLPDASQGGPGGYQNNGGLQQQQQQQRSSTSSLSAQQHGSRRGGGTAGGPRNGR
ncbi:hypothetical protein M406DRAFT_329751 [Cryphonectria parasitica EP155]|uniref:Uncharacterized protein n=1 Tax=Cryphonectria parasitica (strain ATCC 38755 / EP155) TaxID=660469 RepID=A0A9P4Y3K7_CRYP1|nr:uncharacterized protein M406DRAFT_329751 [Cryphonectria parasitica EP155]KAF3765893.1 hypothetical protein M406DRAFT_329751 [Cryphonectria parasitica EP155]